MFHREWIALRGCTLILQCECEDAISPGEGEGVTLAVPGDLIVAEGVGLVAEGAELAGKGMATGNGRFP